VYKRQPYMQVLLSVTLSPLLPQADRAANAASAAERRRAGRDRTMGR